MADTKTIIEQSYSAFNKRNIDGALALMTQDVSWPKASEGGKVVGKEEIRACWTRQWGEFDPQVEPLAMTEEDGGKTRTQQLMSCHRLLTRNHEEKIVPKMYPSSGNGAFLALLASNKINNLRVLNTPQRFDCD
jgi:hypothetical protein